MDFKATPFPLQRFSELVVANVPELLKHGYVPGLLEDQDSVDPTLTWFSKQLAPGVSCAVRFEFCYYHSSPYGFQIFLLRRRKGGPASPERPYEPVINDLVNLARYEYRVDQSQLEIFPFEFEDETECVQQIGTAQSAVLSYGLPWIEDPHSSVTRTRELIKQKRAEYEQMSAAEREKRNRAISQARWDKQLEALKRRMHEKKNDVR